jgi:hypothetical protein
MFINKQHVFYDFTEEDLKVFENFFDFISFTMEHITIELLYTNSQAGFTTNWCITNTLGAASRRQRLKAGVIQQPSLWS